MFLPFSRVLLGAGWLVVASVCSGATTTITEHFTDAASAASNGWAGVGNTGGTHNFGWRNTDFTAGASGAGEAGGVFNRTNRVAFYGDIDLGGTFTLADALHADGELALSNNFWNGDMLIGFFNTNSGGATAAANLLGLNISEPATANGGYRMHATVKPATGAQSWSGIINGTAGVTPQVGNFRFSIDYNPAGNGSVTARITNSAGALIGAQTYNLSAAQRAAGATFNAFGFLVGGQSATANTLDVYMDGVAYTVYQAQAAPTITTQPQSQTAPAGANATFTVTASGTPPLNYQWRFNHADIPGAVTNSFTVTNAQPTNAGSYSVVVTNAFGSVTSAPATLTLMTAATEPFNDLASATGNGWSGSGNADNGNDYGFRASNRTGLTPAGEMGGTFARSTTVSFYGDATLGDALTLAQPLHADGELTISNASFDGNVRIGFFQTSSAGHSALTNVLGLNLAEPGGGSSGFRLTPVIALANGTVLYGATLDLLVTNGNFAFRFDYDPSGGGAGAGQLAMEILNTNGTSLGVRTLDLSSAQRGVGASFNGFGVHNGGTGAGNAALRLDLYLDALTYTIAPDTTAPVVQTVLPAPNSLVRSLTFIEVTFNEPVTNVDAADLFINSVPASMLQRSNSSTYRFTFPQPSASSVTVTWSGAHGITDLASNEFAGGTWNYTLDTVPPVLDVILPQPGTTVSALTGIQVTFSEAVTNVDPADLLINGVPSATLQPVNPSTFLFTFPQPPPGAVTVAWADGHGIADLAGVPNVFAGGSWSYTLDTTPIPGRVMINEIHANPNVKTERVEFVELANTGNTPVSLADWALTAGVEFRFPPGAQIPANGFVIVAEDPASISNRFFGITNLLVPAGALWRYLDDGSDQGTAWLAPGFDDSAWALGPARLGYGEDGRDIRTPLRHGPNPAAKFITTYFRRPVLVANRAGITNCLLRCQRDDGIVVYLNGTEIFRNNLPAGAVNFATTALTDVPITNETAWLSAPVSPSLLLAGTNWLAVEVHQFSGASDDLNFDLELTALRSESQPCAGIFGPYSGKLSGDGGTITLRDAAGQVVNSISYGVGFPWPTVGDDPGHSIQRLNPLADGDLGGHWRGELPTPLAANSLVLTATNALPPALRHVDHSPNQPRSGEPVLLTARITAPAGVLNVTLQYQLVEPGAYLRFSDQAFLTNWISVPMNDAGTNGDTTALDNTFSALLPGALQQHRRLVRYRLVAEDTAGRRTQAPYADDPQPNFAYYCYDGVPAWTGAVQIGQSTMTFDTNVMNSTAVYQLLANSLDVSNSQWNPTIDEPDGDRITWYGTMVVGKKVYDHITYRSRADAWWRLGKNHWRFNFLRGHFLEWEDNFGKDRPVKVEKFGFSSGIDRGTWRGNHGMFESVTFALFNLAGVAAPETSYLQFRVVDGASENGATQYDGDFWGLYMGMEQFDIRFLDAHGLPDGNLYRMRPTVAGVGQDNQGATQVTDWSDVIGLMNTIPFRGRTPPVPFEWWMTNVNVEGYASFRAVVDAVHHYDVFDKNYYYFNHPDVVTNAWGVNTHWWIFPWDVDMTWDDAQWHGQAAIELGNGSIGTTENCDPWKKNGILSHPPLGLLFQNRVRELRDLLWNAEQAGQLIDEHARFVQPLAEADRRMWDYHPAMRYNGISEQGKFYLNFTPHDFSGCVAKMKNWVATRATFLDGLAADAAIPNTPTLTAAGTNFPVNRLTFTCSAFSDPQGAGTFGAMQWRVAEITDTNAPGFDAGAPPHYEINPLWDSGVVSNFTASLTLPRVCKVGHAYRARVRVMDNTGRWSHWSAPAQFIAVEPDTAADLLAFLRVSEVHYNPAGSGFGDYEFVEVVNTSTNLALDLSGVKFTAGIDYLVPTGTVLNAGNHLVFTRTTPAAFRAFYGLSNTVAILGPYSGRLNNDGEEVELKTAAAGSVIAEFTFSPGRGWPLAAAGAGHSLVPRVFAGQPQGALHYGGNWRASAFLHGSPGAPDPEPITDVVLNEIATRTHYADPAHPEFDSNDWIELFNTTSQALDIGGWFLSDDPANLRKWAIPPGTSIGGRAWRRFTEVDDFHQPITSGFGLGGGGESLFLSRLTGGAQDRVADCLGFKAQVEGTTFGRFGDGAGLWWFAESPSPNAANSMPPGHLAISEIMFEPPLTPAFPTNNSNDEFVEIYNPLPTHVTLMSDAGPWRLDGGVAFTFPTNTTLPSGSSLVVVSFSPADSAALNSFVSAHGLTNGQVHILGPYTGKLDNKGERVALEAPMPPDPGQIGVSWSIVDEVIYFTQAPWPTGGKATGKSLLRQSFLPSVSGNDPANWILSTAAPTPGAGPAWPSGAPSPTLRGGELTPDGFRLSFNSPYGLNCRIERATEVEGPYRSITNLFSSPLGVVEFVDPTPPPGRAFYRMVFP